MQPAQPTHRTGIAGILRVELGIPLLQKPAARLLIISHLTPHLIMSRSQAGQETLLLATLPPDSLTYNKTGVRPGLAYDGLGLRG
jgi:hypothetical protein